MTLRTEDLITSQNLAQNYGFKEVQIKLLKQASHALVLIATELRAIISSFKFAT